MSTSATPPLLADRYRVVRRLGAGGMATVFLAEDQRLGRPVAVKRMHADSPEDVARRFEREARLGASLNHPNVVAVFDIVTDPENVLIVMEYVEGETLGDALRRGPMPPARAIEVLRGIAAALDHAHAQGVVHRDVKPANILLGSDGAVKIADLGIATAAENMTHITRTGTVLGTPSYMAPEQLEGGAIGPAADIYALATVAFEMLAGRKARSGRTPVEIAHRVATEPPPDIRDVAPEVPPGTAEALCQAMSREPGQRSATASELVDRLAGALRDATVEMERPLAAPVSADEPDGRAAGAAAAAAGLAGAGAGAAAAGALDGDGARRAPYEPAAPPAPAQSAADEATPAPASAPPSEPAGPAAEPEPTPRPAPTESVARNGGAPAGAAATPGAAEAAGAAQVPGAARPSTREPIFPTADPHRERRPRARPAALAVAGLLLLLAVGAAALVLGSGDDPASQQAAEPPAQQPAERERDQAAGAGERDGGAAESDAGDPAAVVKDFYTLAAQDDFERAYALLSPGGKAVFGSYGRFKGTFDTLESIKFERAEAASTGGRRTTVAIQTVATHTNKVDRCQGTIPVVRDGDGWLVDGIQADCSSSARGASAGGDDGGGKGKSKKGKEDGGE